MTAQATFRAQDGHAPCQSVLMTRKTLPSRLSNWKIAPELRACPYETSPYPRIKNPSAEPAHLLDQRAREAHAGSTVAYARTGKVPTPLTLTGTAVKVNPESGS